MPMIQMARSWPSCTPCKNPGIYLDAGVFHAMAGRWICPDKCDVGSWRVFFLSNDQRPIQPHRLCPPHFVAELVYGQAVALSSVKPGLLLGGGALQ
jgi:hypothetical protein